jgi:hypothetical protein
VARADAATARLTGFASHSVLAAQGHTSMRPAFAFDSEGTIIAGIVGGGSIRLIASSGATATAEPGGREGELAVIHVSGLGLAPLLKSNTGTVRASTPTYVLGPPLGYEADRIRYVHLPPIVLASTHLVSVPGSLAKSFEGAPVVTQGGRVIGAVAAVGAHTWALAPDGRLLALAVAVDHASSAGVPILSLLAGALIVFAAGVGFGVMRAKRRRHRAFEESARRRPRAVGLSEPLLEQPLVQLRTQEPEPLASEIDEAQDDFDVILKPREDS